MIYFQTTTLTEYKHTDAKRFTLTGYPGNIYKAVDTADYGGGVEHCTEWVEKYGYTIKTKAQAQELGAVGKVGDVKQQQAQLALDEAYKHHFFIVESKKKLLV